MTATAVILDSREPDYIQHLTFGGLPVTVTMLDQGDALIACDDGEMILVERKTLSDLLGSIKDGRIFVQAANMAIVTRWRYVVVTDTLIYGAQGNLITPRGETGWSLQSVMGALITLQELGVFVVFCAGDQDYEACLQRLANRKRDTQQIVEPAKLPYIFNSQEQFLASLPGLGAERVHELLTIFSTPAQVLAALTDPNWEIPGIKGGIKQKIRNTLQLADGEQLIIVKNKDGAEVVEIHKVFTQEALING